MDVSLGERELDVLGVLWRHGPGTVPEVRDRLPGELAYNTVLTVLRNLEAKGVVSHSEEGRQHRYHARIAEDRVQRRLVTRLVDKVFGGSPLSLIAHLVEREPLSADDMRALQTLLDDRVAELQVPSATSRSLDAGQGPKTVRAPRTRKPR